MKSTKSTKSVITGLTVKEEAYAQLLAKGHNKYVAHCTVFGVGAGTKKSKTEMAAKLAKKPNLVSYMERIHEETRARGVIDRDEIMGWLREIAEFGKSKRVRSSKFETWEEMADSSAANSAIDKMIKMGGLYAAEKVETEHKVKGRFILNLNERTD